MFVLDEWGSTHTESGKLHRKVNQTSSPSKSFPHANGQSAPRPSGDRYGGKGAGHHTKLFPFTKWWRAQWAGRGPPDPSAVTSAPQGASDLTLPPTLTSSQPLTRVWEVVRTVAAPPSIVVK